MLLYFKIIQNLLYNLFIAERKLNTETLLSNFAWKKYLIVFNNTIFQQLISLVPISLAVSLYALLEASALLSSILTPPQKGNTLNIILSCNYCNDIFQAVIVLVSEGYFISDLTFFFWGKKEKVKRMMVNDK